MVILNSVKTSSSFGIPLACNYYLWSLSLSLKGQINALFVYSNKILPSQLPVLASFPGSQ